MAQTQILNDYPKSSCQCYGCSNVNRQIACAGYPTNISVLNCDIPKTLDCINTLPFRRGNQPTDDRGYMMLNPQAYTNKLATDFIGYSNNCVSGCNSTLYKSSDPRLIDPVLAQDLLLDTVPMDSSLRLDQIYTDPRLCNYGKDYRTYSDITAGQILYYVDRSIQDAYFEPNFVSTANVDSYIYQDPMSALKPRYDRYPLSCDNPVQNTKDKFEYCLSSMQDSTAFREDIMSKQMAKMNQQSWTARYGSSYC
jgi:hypothetical protein